MSSYPTSANKKSRIRCPSCGRGQKDNTCAVKVDDRGACWFCHRCHKTGYFTRDDVAELIAEAIVNNSSHSDPSFAQKLFLQAKEITHEGPAGQYLLARGCALPPPRSHLRWLPESRHPTGFIGPVLLALLSDPLLNTFKTLHRTWIRPDGTKPVEPARLYWAGLGKKGGVCKLWPDDVVELGLGLAEGIENALTLAHGFTPVWACIDAGNLGEFPSLRGIECLTVAQDNDPAGIAVCDLLMRHWKGEFRIIDVASDLNDWVREAA